MAYIYRADVWCNSCGRALCERLTREGKAPANPEDEWTFDSDEYPKRAGDDDESDTPQHCAAGEHCVNAVTLPSGEKVGLLFGELTRDGVEYVKEAIGDAARGLGNKEVVELWRQYYADKGYDLPPTAPDLETLVRELFSHVDRAGHPQTRQGGTAEYDVLVPIPAELLRRLRAACTATACERIRTHPAGDESRYERPVRVEMLAAYENHVWDTISVQVPMSVAFDDEKLRPRAIVDYVEDNLAGQAQYRHVVAWAFYSFDEDQLQNAEEQVP